MVASLKFRYKTKGEGYHERKLRKEMEYKDEYPSARKGNYKEGARKAWAKRKKLRETNA
jgi:hypothetical protein